MTNTQKCGIIYTERGKREAQKKRRKRENKMNTFNVNAHQLNDVATLANAKKLTEYEVEAMRILVHMIQPELIAAAEKGLYQLVWAYSGIKPDVIGIILRKLNEDYGFTAHDDEYENYLTIYWGTL